MRKWLYGVAAALVPWSVWADDVFSWALGEAGSTARDVAALLGVVIAFVISEVGYRIVKRAVKKAGG